MNAKVLIASLFVITLILGVVGVVIYYNSLAPLRDVANCQGLTDVLDRVTYLEYNATDSSGKLYLIKVNNDPNTRSGTITLFINGTKNMTLQYKYDNTGLTALSITYSNGTVKSYQGPQAYVYTESFATSLSLYYNQTSGAARATIFPGIGPLYGLCFIGKAVNINWEYYASLRKPRTRPLEAMQVSVAFGNANFMNETYKSVLLSLTSATGTIPNKWFLPRYTFYLIDYHGLPLAIYYQVLVTSANNYFNEIQFNVISIQTK